LSLHQAAADQLGGNRLSRAGEEGLGEVRQIVSSDQSKQHSIENQQSP